MRSGHFKKHMLWAACVVIVGILAAASLGGCGSPKAASENASSGSSKSSAQAVAWSPDIDCTTCHSDQQASLSNTACLKGMHKDAKCTSCHTDTDGLSKAHESASGTYSGTELESTRVDEKACLSCHGSYDELAAKTASITVLTDSKGTVVNPHAVRTAAVNVKGQHDEITCTTCHTVHASGDSATNAQQECLSCHHQNVYECGTCHKI